MFFVFDFFIVWFISFWFDFNNVFFCWIEFVFIKISSNKSFFDLSKKVISNNDVQFDSNDVIMLASKIEIIVINWNVSVRNDSTNLSWCFTISFDSIIFVFVVCSWGSSSITIFVTWPDTIESWMNVIVIKYSESKSTMMKSMMIMISIILKSMLKKSMMKKSMISCSLSNIMTYSHSFSIIFIILINVFSLNTFFFSISFR